MIEYRMDCFYQKTVRRRAGKLAGGSKEVEEKPLDVEVADRLKIYRDYAVARPKASAALRADFGNPPTWYAIKKAHACRGGLTVVLLDGWHARANRLEDLIRLSRPTQRTGS